jgi:hypothetical protein
MKKILFISILIFGLLLASGATAMAALSITYDLTDLGSTEENLWQIEYHVKDFDSTEYAGLQVVFDYDLYDGHIFFVMEPQVDLFVNLSRHLKLGVTFSYRFINEERSDFDGLSFGCNLQFNI